MELYYVVSIVDAAKANDMIKICHELKLSVGLEKLGLGTAKKEHLLLYDLQKTDKAIISTIAGKESLSQLTKYAKLRMLMDIPGNGIIMAIPIKSVSGGKTLSYMTEGQKIGGNIPKMKFTNEMIVVVMNEGYSDMIMDAAREAGATGGTVIHAKSIGNGNNEKFHGVSLVSEKDMLYILAPENKKSEIMKLINQKCGWETEAEAFCFSLPVTEVVGLRKFNAEQV